MTTTSVIVLAQGRQTRFKSLTYPKCLIRVGDYTLLERTWRLLPKHASNEDAHAHDVVRVVADTDRLRGHGLPGFIARTLDDPGFCILDGLAQTTDLWSRDGRTIVLLGDVCYSRAAMRSIFEESEPDLMFYQSPDLTAATGEIYALAFRSSWNVLLAELIENMPCRKIAHTVAQPGHLRNLEFAVASKYGRVYHSTIDDFTTDFDVDADLAQIPELERAIAAEAAKEAADEEARRLHADVCERIPYRNPNPTKH